MLLLFACVLSYQSGRHVLSVHATIEAESDGAAKALFEAAINTDVLFDGDAQNGVFTIVQIDNGTRTVFENVILDDEE